MTGDVSKIFKKFITRYNIDIMYFVKKSISHIFQSERSRQIKCTQLYKIVVYALCAAEKTLRDVQSLQ